MSDKPKTGGLAGVVAGRTAICTVGKEGSGLTYRGYSIHDLAQRAGFEEVAYLLLYGELPSREELDQYQQRLVELRSLPQKLKPVLEQLPSTAHPMDVLRTGCSALGCLEPERRFADQQEIADRLLAVFPAIVLYWYHYAHHGRRIDTATGQSRPVTDPATAPIQLAKASSHIRKASSAFTAPTMVAMMPCAPTRSR